MTSAIDTLRIRQNLEFIEANPTAVYPRGWVAEVRAEARAAGVLPPLAPVVGCNCKPGIDAGIIYGGDFAD